MKKRRINNEPHEPHEQDEVFLFARFVVELSSDGRALAAAMDLQWFAAEDEGRTFDATPEAIRRAREEGRVAKSQDLIGALVLLLPAVVLFFYAPRMLRVCTEMVRFFFTRATQLDAAKDGVIMAAFLYYLAQLALPLLLTAVVAAILSNLMQVGFLFTTKPLVPDFTKIIPRFGEYFKRTLFSVDAMFNLGKSLFKLAIIGGVAFVIIRLNVDKLANLQTASLWNGIRLVSSMAGQMLIICALLLLLLAIPDWFFQRWRYKEQLKMTRQMFMEDIKQEYGDPQVRSRINQRFRALMNNSAMMKEVPKADVVVTNPTHFAVALRYQEGMYAPVVTAKGADAAAFAIRRIAEQSGVPIEESPPLARALFAAAEVGDFVPEHLFDLVAAVLARVRQLNEERMYARQRAGEE